LQTLQFQNITSFFALLAFAQPSGSAIFGVGQMQSDRHAKIVAWQGLRSAARPIQKRNKSCNETFLHVLQKQQATTSDNKYPE
jgi:hypothetical protein